MKRGKMTYAPLYFEDFKKGCEDLTNEQIGAYLRVLFEIYEAMGPINFDDRLLAKRLNNRPHKARAIVEDLISRGKLFLTPTGQISNHRAEDEIMRFVSISVQNSLNASSNGLNRNSKRKNANSFNVSAERTPSDRSHILEKNNISSSLDVADTSSPLPPADRSKKALEDYHRRQRQRQAKGRLHS